MTVAGIILFALGALAYESQKDYNIHVLLTLVEGLQVVCYCRGHRSFQMLTMQGNWPRDKQEYFYGFDEISLHHVRGKAQARKVILSFQ